MIFSKDELGVIYQYATNSKAQTIADLKEILPVIKQEQTRAIVESTIEKLSIMPDKQCVKLMTDTKTHFLQKRDKSVLCRLKEAQERTKEQTIKGHELQCVERYMEDTRHMIIVQITANISPLRKIGERHRLFLSDEGYNIAKDCENRGELRIKSHASVKAGKIFPDKDQEQEKE